MGVNDWIIKKLKWQNWYVIIIIKNETRAIILHYVYSKIS